MAVARSSWSDVTSSQIFIQRLPANGNLCATCLPRTAASCSVAVHFKMLAVGLSPSMGACNRIKRFTCSGAGSSSQQLVLQASSMEDVYEKLAKRLFSAAETMPSNCQYLVGLAGSPGAGKSTLAKEVVSRLNGMWFEKERHLDGSLDELAIALPMDGFHLYRWELDSMEDPVEAHARRGAPWTFDSERLVQRLIKLRNQGWASFPSFDHGIGDPIQDDIVVTSRQKVVLVEGNYLLLSDGHWKELTPIFDETWFIQVDITEAMKRVERRHIETGETADRAAWRVRNNDQLNAELVSSSAKRADVVIPSIHTTA